jgi:branched-chain amino acid transport system ATP-binding protein
MPTPPPGDDEARAARRAARRLARQAAQTPDADADADADAAEEAAPRRRRSRRATTGTAPTAAAPRTSSETPVVLSCQGVSVRFGGLDALADVHLDVREGEIVGLIGPNGAGKTTLMECISGFQRVTAGGVAYRGQDLLVHAPGDRADLGIGRTLQNVRLFPYLTIVDNLRVALHRHSQHGVLSHAFSLPASRHEEQSVLAEAERLVELLGMQAFAEKYASELSYGTLRLLELGCMLALKPNFLLLDEPASGISQKETEALGPLLRRIKEQTSATILLIEHDMPLIMSLSDWIYVLDAGRNLSEGPPEVVQADPAVIEAYLGTPAEQRKVAAQAKRKAQGEDEAAPVLLDIKGIDLFYDKVQVLYGVDFHVRKGERVALLGTNGAGKSTVLKAASRLVDPSAGTITWRGQDIKHKPAEHLVRDGLGHVPGGRGMFPTLTVGENLRMGGYIFKDESRVDAELERVMKYFPWIKDRLDQQAGTLSGGEQQQLATARALIANPELLMIDELSLGLAPVVVERLMDTVQQMHEEEGLTVVIVEQQASFALGYTDRAYFLEKGEVRYEGPSAGLSERPDLLRSVFLAGAAAGFEGGRA